MAVSNISKSSFLTQNNSNSLTKLSFRAIIKYHSTPISSPKGKKSFQISTHVRYTIYYHQMQYSRQLLQQMLKQQCIYLQHDYVEIEGIRIFGSPYTLKYGSSAFQYGVTDDQKVWANIPQVDILITHCPPYGILDKSKGQKSCGSQSLRKQVFRIKPKLHFFGHIHESRGQTTIQGIRFMNVAKQSIQVQYHKSQ